MLVDELADVVLGVDLDLHQEIVFAAGREEFGDNLAFEQRVGDLVGLARLALELHENGSHRDLSIVAAARSPAFIVSRTSR
jgi:hypothetical protein